VQKTLKKIIPKDHSRQVGIEYYIENILKISQENNLYTILDLGCGRGESIKYFYSLNKKIEWFGVDIKQSPEVLTRDKKKERVITFDGNNLPFQDNSFDLIYCKQVFEHVKYPRELLIEIQRILKPGGHFVGSTSYLEPYHSYSVWNYTPYGFSLLIHESKLKLLELRPGIDSLTLIMRRAFRDTKLFNIFWKVESPLNFAITVIGKIFMISAFSINSIKLLFCGHFIFFVTKDKPAV